MKAIVYHCYGSPDVLRLEEIEKPVPQDNEILIEVRAASVNPAGRLFRGTSFIVRILTGLRKPKDTRLGRDVAGVCSKRNAEMVRSIGADRVIDYSQEDFTKGMQCYDLIFDCVGNHSLSACRRALNPHGICVLVGAPHKVRIALIRALKALVLSRFVSQKFVMFIARSSKEDLTIMRELMKAGKVTPVIDKRYMLSEVPDAIRYLEEGHARGKVVITLEYNKKQ